MVTIKNSNNRHYEEREEPEVCREEVIQLIKTLKKRKATAEDRIPNEVVETIYEAIENDLLRLYQDCLARRVFPKV